MWNWYLKENSAEKIGLEYMKNKYLFPSQKMFVGRKAIELQIWTCQLQQLVEHISISSTQGEAIARGEEESTQLERGDHRRWKLAVKGDKTNKGSHSELGLHSVYSCLCNLRRERERERWGILKCGNDLDTRNFSSKKQNLFTSLAKSHVITFPLAW